MRWALPIYHNTNGTCLIVDFLLPLDNTDSDHNT